jgi:hypothetical protein
VAMAGLATWLRMYNSSLAAGLLMLLTIFIMYLNVSAGNNSGVIMGLVVVIAAWRALGAAMVLQDARSSAA